MFAAVHEVAVECACKLTHSHGIFLCPLREHFMPPIGPGILSGPLLRRSLACACARACVHVRVRVRMRVRLPSG